MLDPAVWQEIITVLQDNASFVLTTHTTPDCDGLGSELALAEHLQNLGKKTTILNSSRFPAGYRFLDPQQRIKKYTKSKHASVIQKAAVIIVLDASGGWDRIGQIGQQLAEAQGIKLCIDHHPDATDFVDAALIDTEAAATAELIYNLLITMGGSLSPVMAQALYAGIVTDTGSFRYPKTRPETHRIVAELLQAGANPAYIYRQLYEQASLPLIQLRGQVSQSIQTAAGGQIAYYSLSRSDMKAYGLKRSDLDGFASLGQEIAGVRVTIFCREETKGRVKISLRSDGSVAINQLAAAYDGGGHPSAAGALTTGKLDEVMAALVEKTTALLDE